MPLVIYKLLGLGELKPTSARLFMADSSINEPLCIEHNIEVMVASFIYLVDFISLDYKVDA